MRRLVVFLALTSLVAGIFGVLSPSAFGNGTAGNFEIDGNLVDSPPGEPIDWSTPPPNLTNFNDVPPAGQRDGIFGNGSKELEPGGWSCITGSAPAKDDIKEGQIAFRTVNGKQFIYVNFTRFGVNGDAHIDYEFNKSTTPNTACPALPMRTNGDIVITFDTENGGATIFVRAFRWTFNSGSTTKGTFTQLAVGSEHTTWDGAVNIPNTIPDHTAGDFGEASLNLTDTIGNVACGQFATAYMKSRASTSINAALKDRTVTQPANVGDCPNSRLDKAVRVYPNGTFGTNINANPGNTLEYRLTYSNAGAVAATNVVVTDVIQPKQTFVAGSCDPACTGTGTQADPLRWTFASVPAGESRTMTFRVTLDAGGWQTGSGNTVRNVAVVDTAEEAPKNSNETVVTVTATPNSTILKEVRVYPNGSFGTTTTAVPGNTLEYRITYTNTGNVTLTNVVITDEIQPKQTFVSGSCDPACTGTGSAADPLRWTFASVAVGEVKTMTFRVVLDASFPNGPTQVRNTAVSDSNEEAPKSSTTTVTVNAIVSSSVAKTARVYPNGTAARNINANPGDTIEYSISYMNTGNVPLTNVVITDVIQPRQTFVAGSCNPACTGTGTAADPLRWTFATVAPGETKTMTFRVVLDATFPPGTTHVQNVAVSDSDQEPPTNSPPTDITVTANPNLGLQKSGSSSGTQITWTISYSNTGNAAATNVVITDDIPAGTAFVSCSQNPACTTTGSPVSSVSWNIGTVNPGGSGSVTLTVDVTGTSGCEICNVASISSPDQTGGARNSNQSCVEVTPAPNPAGANASGNATSAIVEVGLLGLDVTLPDGDGVDDDNNQNTSVESAQSGIGSDNESDELLTIDLPPDGSVLHADLLRSVTTSTVTGNPAEARALSVGSAANVCILPMPVTGCTVAATAVRGVASATATGSSVNVSSLGSAIEGLRVLGVAQAVYPGAIIDLNDLNPLFGVGSYVAIYEENKSTSTPSGTSGGAYVGDISVDMIHVHVTSLLTLTNVEVVVGHAAAHADFPQTTLCGPQRNQAVSGHAYMARLLTDPSIAPLIVGGVQIPTSGGFAENTVNSIFVPDGVLTSRAATTNSSGSFSPINTMATSSAEVKGLCLLETAGVCTISARAVRTQANSTATSLNATSDSAGTDFVALKIGDLTVSLPVPANTVIEVPGIGFVILNEQFCDNNGTLANNCSDGSIDGHTGITVRAVHLILLDPAAGGPPGVDLIVAESHSDALYV